MTAGTSSLPPEGARRRFLVALSQGYRAAAIDLADLLARSPAAPADALRAVALYERAWEEGVAIAAFELGRLYETGVGHVHGATADVVPRDFAQAWYWYQKGAAIGEPSALARVASRAEQEAIAAGDPEKGRALLLEAFRRYAAAVARAEFEGWPETALQRWRHRRASLARVLARDGRMQELADAYEQARGEALTATPAR